MIYRIVPDQMDVQSNSGNIFWNATLHGADQEVFVTLTNVDTAGVDHDLVLKSQALDVFYSGSLEIWYDAVNHRVIPRRKAGWNMEPRSRSPYGSVEVYRNGVLLATRDVTAWPYYASGGYIGLWFINASDSANCRGDFQPRNPVVDTAKRATPASY